MDAYHSPEKLGLTVTDEIDYSSGGWEFDLRVIWRDKKGNYYTARDAGCSCPSPFEGYTTLDDLDQINTMDLITSIRRELDESRYADSGDADAFRQTLDAIVKEKELV